MLLPCCHRRFIVVRQAFSRPPTPLEEIGPAIRAVRAERGVTLEQAAFSIGVLPQKLADWETGLALLPRPDVPTLVRWLGCNPFTVPADLAGRLQVCALLLGLSAVQMAADIGVCDDVFRSWLKGRTRPQPHLLPRLAKLFAQAGLSLPDNIPGDCKPKRSPISQKQN